MNYPLVIIRRELIVYDGPETIAGDLEISFLNSDVDAIIVENHKVTDLLNYNDHRAQVVTKMLDPDCEDLTKAIKENETAIRKLRGQPEPEPEPESESDPESKAGSDTNKESEEAFKIPVLSEELKKLAEFNRMIRALKAWCHPDSPRNRGDKDLQDVFTKMKAVQKKGVAALPELTAMYLSVKDYVSVKGNRKQWRHHLKTRRRKVKEENKNLLKILSTQLGSAGIQIVRLYESGNKREALELYRQLIQQKLDSVIREKEALELHLQNKERKSFMTGIYSPSSFINTKG